MIRIAKLDRLLTRLQAAIFVPTGTFVPLRFRQFEDSERGDAVRSDRRDWVAVDRDLVWGEPDGYYWFGGTVEIPPALAGQPLFGRVLAAFGSVMGRSDPPGTVEIPGIRENLHGLFGVHVGVHVEEVWRLEFGRVGPDGEPTPKSWVNDYDCQLRAVVENPGGDPLNLMWRLDDPEAVREVRDALETRALPWLDRYASRADILAAVERVPVLSREVRGVGPDRLLATRMLLTAGARSRAQQLFDDYVGDCRARLAAEPHVRGHLEYLAEFASRAGLAMPDGHRPS